MNSSRVRCARFTFFCTDLPIHVSVFVEGEVEMTDLDKNVSELKHKITNLEYDIKDAMEQRYMKFAVVSKDAASLLETTLAYSNQINNLIQRIDNQVRPKHTIFFTKFRYAVCKEDWKW